MEVQKSLPPGQALVEYFLADSVLYTFCFSEKKSRLLATSLPPDFQKIAADFRRSVSDWEFLQKEPAAAEQAYIGSAHRLFQILLQPALDSLNKNSITSLVIVPDGVLGYLPFEALLTQPVARWKSPGLPYLVRDLAVSQAFSIQHLLHNPAFLKKRGRASERFGGFGLTYDDFTLGFLNAKSAVGLNPADFENPPGLAPATRSFEIGKLPYSTKEVRKAALLFGGQFWLDVEATKENFLRHATRCDIVHFAGHSFTDARNPLNSSIIFSKTTDTTDNLLRSADLYGLQFPAQLAVLSACNTGSGELRRGEGIMSFSRAFAYAGVPSLLMSLWSITDESTAGIVSDFYGRLKKGERKDAALRSAKLSYLQRTNPEHSLPIYWAGLVLAGDAGPVEEGGRAVGYWLLAVGMGLLAIGFWFFGKSRGEKNRA